MAKLVLGLSGESRTNTRSANDYVAGSLGRTGGTTLLAELFPLPSPDAKVWSEEYRVWYASRAEYEGAVAAWRRGLLAEALDQSEPRLVLAYGVRHWPHYRRLFNDVEFGKPEGLDVRFWVGRRGATVVVLSPFLGNGQMSHDALESLIEYLRGEGVELT